MGAGLGRYRREGGRPRRLQRTRGWIHTGGHRSHRGRGGRTRGQDAEGHDPEDGPHRGRNLPDAAGDDEEALKNNAGIHLEGTGFPWEDGANTYLAGHRLGYPNEPSFLAFWDLDALENGDEVFVEDADGNRYTYRVFKEFVVNPTDLYVTEPVPGKDVLTLQTCTLPDYSRRLIVQAELIS
ncbi:sortase [Rubrobacter marinus]|uniref:sortase n=1 Tax=Rubrobacter marinus TaxID=2653852 RepID=UPI002B1BD603|nr:sortase [Rubrobacter marinus]